MRLTVQEPKRSGIDQRTEAERMQAFRRWQKTLAKTMDLDAIRRDMQKR